MGEIWILKKILNLYLECKTQQQIAEKIGLDRTNIGRKITEIEKMFRDIKEIKEKEERELEFWKEEIRNIKEKIERVDKNIFSKLD